MAVTYSVPGIALVEHEFSVPLDHARPDGDRITVFAREVADLDGRDKPFLLFLQGGPGHEASRPTGRPSAPGWMARALSDFRVLMLDQRGTGRSEPVGTLPGMTAAEQAAYLTHFRADSIVRDAEWIRRELEVERWSILGQSFGGFCATTYLSFAPEGLREAFITGGLPPVGRPIDDFYGATYARMLDRNRLYYERHPADLTRVRELHGRAEKEDLRLPNGDRLTPRRVRQLGVGLGMSDGAEQLHHLLERPFDSPAFRHDAQDPMGVGRNPLYAIVHEACAADGGASRWSAERVRPPEFTAPEIFTGEHVGPWMFEEYGALAPLRDAAGLLAEHEWPRLYDPERLAANDVPVAAAIYTEDPYVERAFSEETAALIRGTRAWVTSEYDHNGLRADGARVLGRLIDMARGRA
jgi:pimeloyl-ACP methyl ester carboxylesterase